MLRKASNADISNIVPMLWQVRSHFKARQCATRLTKFPSIEVLTVEIESHLDQWLVFETADAGKNGFFQVIPLETEPANKLFRPPKNAIRVEQLAVLQSGELLLQQFQELAAYFPVQSIFVTLPDSCRDAYWAVLKAGFRLLGESPTIIGNFMWLLLDRDQCFDAVQTKLRRTKLIAL